MKKETVTISLSRRCKDYYPRLVRGIGKRAITVRIDSSVLDLLRNYDSDISPVNDIIKSAAQQAQSLGWRKVIVNFHDEPTASLFISNPSGHTVTLNSFRKWTRLYKSKPAL